MTFCIVCKTDWDSNVLECPVCGRELTSERDTKTEWVMLGTVEDKLSADFAREVLASYEIPAVVISKSGFFGEVGLTLSRFYEPGMSLFEISVPDTDVEEAADVLTMALGDKWKRETN